MTQKKLPDGSIVALITPFKEDGSVNEEKLKELVEFHIANHTDGILVLGTTGETPTMTHEEDDVVVQTVLDTAKGRIPVIVGTGSNNSAVMRQKSLDYQNMGADALLLISPYYNKANQEGLKRHFLLTADAVDIPCILYNIPGRTGVNIPVSTVAELSMHPNIQGIMEASGNISYVADIAPFLNENFKLYSGNDDMIVPVLSLGGSGVISVLANIVPEDTHELVMSYLRGDVKKSRDLQLGYLNLIHNLFSEVNPIPVKAAMEAMGFGTGGVRLPLYEMSAPAKEKLLDALKEKNLL